MIGIVLVAHGALASGLKDAAEMIVGPQERFRAIGMDAAADLDQLRHIIEAAAAEVGSDGGLLVLADLMGGSPANASAALALQGVPVICGVNLPMLLEVLIQREQVPLQQLVQIAVGAALQGIVNMAEQLRGAGPQEPPGAP
jgi:PTS system mannose-specific IIA component